GYPGQLCGSLRRSSLTRSWELSFLGSSVVFIRLGALLPCDRSKQSAGEFKMRDIIIEAHGLKRYYRRGSETVKALDGVDISIRTGEIVSILGPSGSGKITLINLLSCLDAPTEGTLMVAGKS